MEHIDTDRLPAPSFEPQPPLRKRDTVGWGVLLSLALHVVGQGISAPLVSILSDEQQYAGLVGLIWAMNIGWTQAVYVLPAIFVLRRQKRRGMLKGVLIVSGILFLITTACTGLVLISSRF